MRPDRTSQGENFDQRNLDDARSEDKGNTGGLKYWPQWQSMGRISLALSSIHVTENI